MQRCSWSRSFFARAPLRACFLVAALYSAEPMYLTCARPEGSWTAAAVGCWRYAQRPNPLALGQEIEHSGGKVLPGQQNGTLLWFESLAEKLKFWFVCFLARATESWLGGFYCMSPVLVRFSLIDWGLLVCQELFFHWLLLELYSLTFLFPIVYP